jgi:hypothetical protein
MSVRVCCRSLSQLWTVASFQTWNKRVVCRSVRVSKMTCCGYKRGLKRFAMSSHESLVHQLHAACVSQGISYYMHHLFVVREKTHGFCTGLTEAQLAASIGTSVENLAMWTASTSNETRSCDVPVSYLSSSLVIYGTTDVVIPETGRSADKSNHRMVTANTSTYCRRGRSIQ